MSVTVVDAGKVLEFKMDVSHIVTVGCSFTYCQGLDDKLEIGWPALVAKHFNAQLTNLAQPGIGNDAIYRRTCEYICNNLQFENSKPLIIIAWSQIDRHEQWYRRRIPDPMFNDYHLVSKPNTSLPQDLYQQIYLNHYDEVNFYRKTHFFKRFGHLWPSCLAFLCHVGKSNTKYLIKKTLYFCRGCCKYE